MSELSNYLDIALGVVREGKSIFTKNISKYNQLEKNIGREVKIRADRELNKILVGELNKLISFNINKWLRLPTIMISNILLILDLAA